MARLRHFAVCVKDLEKAAKFYENVFELKRIGREDLDIGSAIYMSDGVINLALLNFTGAAGSKASDLKDPSAHVGAHHFGFQVDDLAETQKRIEANGGKFFFDFGQRQGASGDGLVEAFAGAEIGEDFFQGVESEALDQELDHERRFVIGELEVQRSLGREKGAA